MISDKVVKVHHGYTITEGDMELAKYKYFLEQSLDMLYDVSFRYIDYKAKNSTYCNKPATKKESRTRLKYSLDQIVDVVWEAEDDYPDKWVNGFNRLILLDYLDEPHFGDCTKQCCSCTRCYVERLIGCETNVDNTKYIPKGD